MHAFVVKITRLAGIQAKSADRLAFKQQPSRSRRAKFPNAHALVYGTESPIGRDVVANAGTALASSCRHRHAAARLARVERYLDSVDSVGAGAEVHHGPDHSGFAVYQSHPRILEA